MLHMTFSRMPVIGVNKPINNCYGCILGSAVLNNILMVFRKLANTTWIHPDRHRYTRTHTGITHGLYSSLIFV